MSSDNNSKYLISAVVSTYNAERFMQGCLEDLEAQTIADRLEIIVVDTGSEENESEIVREFQEKYDNIRYYRVDARETVYQAWNRGIRLAHGKYLTNANTDDRHRKDALERLVEVLEAHPEASLAYGNCLVTETENERFEDCTVVGRCRMPDFTRRNLLASCIVGPQPVWRRSLHDELGFFDEQYRCGADYEFWLRVSEKYNFIHIREYLGLYLANKNGVSMKGDQPAREMLAIQEAYRTRFFTQPHLKSGQVELFRVAHQLHMDKSCVNVLVTPNVSKTLMEDLLRLPGLTICPINGSVASVRWDIALIDILDAQVAVICDLMSRLHVRYIGISGLPTPPLEGTFANVVDRLIQFGCSRVFPDVPVFEWTDPIAFGNTLYKQGRVEQAMAFLGKTLASDPTDTKLLNTLSRMALEEGFVDTAEGFALKAARLDRRCSDSLINLARVCMAKGEYQRANELSTYILDIDKTKQQAVEELMGPHLSRWGLARTAHRPLQQRHPIRILVVNNLYPPQELGGYGRNIADFASLLEQRGHEIHVLTSDTRCFGEPAENEPRVRRELHLCGMWEEKGQRLFDRDTIHAVIRRNQETIQRTLGEFHPDICLAGNIDLLGIPVFEPLFHHRIPILHYLGNGFPGYNPPDYPRDPGYHVATASHWLKQDAIRRGYPLQDAQVIYPGAFVKSFNMAVPPETDTLRIAYAGLVTDSKGPQVLIEALHILSRNGINFLCAIAGGTINKRFLEGLAGVVQDLGLADKIHFTGQLDREGLKNLFGKSNVLVFPSLAHETFGISQVEGMAAGLLLVSSGPGGAREVMEDGKHGLYFEPGKPGHLAQRLLSLTRDRSRWEELALSGQRRAMALFDIERSVGQLESRLCRILEKRNRRVMPVSTVACGTPPVSVEAPQTDDEIREIRPVRLQLAQLCLNTSLRDLRDSYQHTLDKWHRRFSCSELKIYPLTREEEAFVAQEVNILSGHPGDDAVLQHVLAAMLYLRPYQMPITLDLEQVPSWLQPDYFRFLIEVPVGVLRTGESDGYYQHIQTVVRTLAERIRMQPDSTLWAAAAGGFAQHSLLTPLYFTRHSLKDIYVARGEISHYVWTLAGCQLDYTFGPRPIDRKKIRVGIYLSGFQSITEMYATLPLFEFLDRQDFEVFLYVSEQTGNDQERHFRRPADRFVVMPKDMKEWAETIRGDDLDILFFGNNTTAGFNSSTILGTHRLARVQCVHFCSPVTTGLKHMDYFLMGTFIDPEGKAEKEYSEKLLKMPGSGICFSMGPQSKSVPGRSIRSDFGIPQKGTLFVSGANFFKINPELRSIWASIVARVQESVLVLYPFGPAWSRSYPERPFTEEMKAVFARYGIARERLVVLKPLENRDHIKSFLMLADVYLDATPYSGATSLLDPLEMGVPPVVTEGAELRFCQGAAMLKELGVPDLVAKSDEDYVRLAVTLGSDPDFRQAKSIEIRQKMAQRPPFLDPRSYAKKVGRVLKSLMEGR